MIPSSVINVSWTFLLCFRVPSSAVADPVLPGAWQQSQCTRRQCPTETAHNRWCKLLTALLENYYQYDVVYTDGKEWQQNEFGSKGVK